jgi:septum formation protein
MLIEKLKNYRIILASASPRRRFLLSEIGVDFDTTELHNTNEEFPDGLSKTEIPVFLAEEKSLAYNQTLQQNEILITADTIVWLKNEVINKPSDRSEAIKILKKLSGNMHEVVTGVCIRSHSLQKSFFSQSEVYFDELEENEIVYYVDHFKPYDKAGSYGIQEWIGYIGISRINGSFYNVMGLPIHMLYEELKKFLSTIETK